MSYERQMRRAETDTRVRRRILPTLVTAVGLALALLLLRFA
ncbi:MAG TPA: hypothetical protein VL551_05420 [Actinospica sp.]|jgi:hypothetical protein|nr:hypothetical protein [Actinospica sp.]